MKYIIIFFLLLFLCTGCQILDRVKDSKIDISPEEIATLLKEKDKLIEEKEDLVKLIAEVKAKVESKEISLNDAEVMYSRITGSKNRVENSIRIVTAELKDINEKAKAKSNEVDLPIWLILLINAGMIAGRHFIPGLSTNKYLNKVNGDK